MMGQSNQATSADESRRVAPYFALLALAVGLGGPSGALVNLPVMYFLKQRLGLGPEAVASCLALVKIPLYLGFLFGFLRDRWRPFGWGDRGYFLLAAPVAVGCYLWLAAGKVELSRLLGALLLATVMFQLLSTATEALMTSVAQRQLMTGRLSSLSYVAAAAPGILAGQAGGWLTTNVAPGGVFLIAAAWTAWIALQAFWRPRAVFASEPEQLVAGEGGWSAVRRLIGHRPLWPAAAILLLWDFAPGWYVPLYFYLTKERGLSEQVFGSTQAISAGCIAAAAAVYGLLCRRIALKRLLWGSLVLGILSGPLYILIRTAPQAIAISVAVGLLLGITNAGFRDLLMRACPRGLEGTGRMLGASASALAVTGGDIFGAWLYQRGGFGLCLVITTATTALILPLLLALPRALTATRDGEGAGGDAPEAPANARERIVLDPLPVAS